MRYQQVDDIVYTDKNGKSVTIKDMREYPEYTQQTTVMTKADDMVDEIAVRNDIYGANAEHRVYSIYEFNIENFYENNMNMIKTLRIPN